MKKNFRLLLFLLSVLIVPALCQASVTILSSSYPNHTITSGSDEQVYGTSASNQITLESDAKAELINFPGQNAIEIQSSSDLFTVSRSGTVVTFQGSDGTVLKIPATTDVQTIYFTDQVLMLNIFTNIVMLGDREVTTDFLHIEPPSTDMCLDVSIVPSFLGSWFDVNLLSINGKMVESFPILSKDAHIFSIEQATHFITDDGIIAPYRNVVNQQGVLVSFPTGDIIARYRDVIIQDGVLVSFNVVVNGCVYVYPRDKCK
jgi:hypothetical protein